MEQRHIGALELPKILEMLTEHARCDDTKEMVFKIAPENNFRKACQSMRYTDDAYKLSCRYGSPTILNIKNRNNSLKRASAGATLTPIELMGIAEVLRTIRGLQEWRKHSQDVETSLDEYFEALMPNKYLEDKINAIVLGEDEIADNASPELANIRRKMKNAQQRARDQLDKIVKSQTYQKFLQDSIITMRDGRYVVPVKSEYRSEIKGLVHDTSASGATLFIEPIGVVEANNEVRVLEAAERDEIEKILKELSAETGTFADSIIAGYNIVLELDLFFAKASLGASMKACVPKLNDTGETVLIKARHPLIPAGLAVPIDLHLGKEFDTLVITGPNTGGKTVSLKTVGLFTLMAMCGLMIPANDESEICIFDNVLADIGDEQSIEQSLSTFSAHMTNIISILQKADENSLVLIDELGAGTDPVEGAALAVSILEELRMRGSKVVATTHYAEIKIFALQTNRVENACCEFDVATLRPTYKLLIGVPGRSNAFAISKRLGLPESVIERAKEKLSGESVRFEDVVQSLETSRQEYEKQNREIALLKVQLQEKKQAADEFYERLNKDKQNEMEKARYDACRVVEQARFEAQQLLDELEQLRKEKSTVDISSLAARAKAEIRSRLNKMEENADPVEKSHHAPYKLPRPLKAGDYVILTDINKGAVVLEPADKQGNVLVQAGIIKTKVPVGNVRLDQSKNKEKQPVGKIMRTVKSKATAPISRELDLRGMDSEEAIILLDRFIDDAVLTGVDTIRIIHGKGTGILRAAVQTHLKKHKSIKSYRLGVYGEGESGVTIAELK
mgnify:CR=1 FL=1